MNSIKIEPISFPSNNKYHNENFFSSIYDKYMDNI